MTKGIDVSYFQGSIDWNKVKASGVDFVIIRTGYGTHTTDHRFEEYVKGATSAGIKIAGVYHFSYALSNADAKNEAEYCLKQVKKVGLPKDTIVFYDFEYDSVSYAKKRGVTLGQKDCVEFTKTFCDAVRKEGYKPGVYANVDYYNNYYGNGKGIPDDAVFWLADWRNNPDKTIINKASFHQYSSSGKVDGIVGNVDLDYLLIEENKKVDIEKIADDVIAGKYGNGEARKKALAEAGYDYSAVQKRVNEKLASSGSSKPREVTTELVQDVIAGKYGNGDDRKKRLADAGYVYSEVQAAVDKALSVGNKSVTPAQSYDKNLAGKYTVTATALNLRYIPGLLTENNVVKILYKNTSVQCWGYYTIKNNSKWYMVQYGNYTGYVDSRYVKKA